EKIVRPETLAKHRHNLVVHPSALPKGRGWSPLAWQILEGKNRIPVTLFEAKPSVDSGAIYFQEFINFQGHELSKEIKSEQGQQTLRKKSPHICPARLGREDRSFFGAPARRRRRSPRGRDDQKIDA